MGKNELTSAELSKCVCGVVSLCHEIERKEVFSAVTL